MSVLTAFGVALIIAGSVLVVRSARWRDWPILVCAAFVVGLGVVDLIGQHWPGPARLTVNIVTALVLAVQVAVLIRRVRTPAIRFWVKR